MVLYTTHAPTVQKRANRMINYIDTHTHLFVEEFDDDRDAAVARAREAGVNCLCLPSINAASIAPIMRMCDKYPDVCYPMIGLHPTDVADDFREQLKQMHSLLRSNNNFIAIGEVGLDFYWDDTRKEQQIEAFETQIEWAASTELPLVIHSRSAFESIRYIMEKHREQKLTGIFHCFSGTADEARALLSFHGFMLGIGGTLTYKKSTLPQILAEAVPLDRIVLETDSPYLAPVPKRGRRNESAYIPHIASHLAAIYNCSQEEIARITTANALKVFTKIPA